MDPVDFRTDPLPPEAKRTNEEMLTRLTSRVLRAARELRNATVNLCLDDDEAHEAWVTLSRAIEERDDFLVGGTRG